MMELVDLQNALATYRTARLQLLHMLGVQNSNRDPLAEFSERLIALLESGTLAPSRVQKGYDVVGPQGEKIQVKYLANPTGEWINGHTVQMTSDMDAYAVVFFVNLEPTLAIIFPRDRLSEVCERLSKRHGNRDTTLQLTRHNIEFLRDHANDFKPLEVRVYDLTQVGPAQ